MKVSRYHRFLRVSLLVLAFLLVFDSGVLFPITKQLSNTTTSYLASAGAGMFASVPENEINTLTAQISQKQRELDAREAALADREIAARIYDTDGGSDYSTYIIAALLFIIIVLLCVNYVLDFVRYRRFITMTHEKRMG